MRTIFSRIKIKIGAVAEVVLFVLASSVAAMLLPSFFANMIDEGVKTGDKDRIIYLAVVMLIVSVLAGLAGIVANRISSRIIARFSADLRHEIFAKIQQFSAANLDKFGTTSLITRSTADVASLQNFLSFVLRFGLMAPLAAISGLVLASLTGGELSVVLIVVIPVLLIVCAVLIIFIIRYSKKLRKKVDELNLLFLETLEGVRVIRAFNKQKFETDRFNKTNAEHAALAAASGRVTGLLTPAIQTIFGFASSAVLSLGAFYIYAGEMEIGTLVANTQYINTILMSIILLTMVIVVFPMAYTCAKRIEEVLLAEPTIKDGELTLADKKCSGTVEFKDVTFAYPGADVPVLKNISFAARPGEVVAIIGRTGSGKSTLVKLIPRCYDVTFGEVLVDGINVKQYKQNDLRSLIGYVPQKNVLFSGDIASNLNFGDANGTEAAWKEAADIACASEFIETKTDTYHDPIAQGGTNLSGGQRQRMAIARAVMKKPEIYLFDDSFSALDVKTDKKLRENIREKCGDATVIMVAQRISSVVDADRILVLENNCVVGNGTHKQLLKTCPLYREIAVLQMGEEAVSREEA